MTSVNVGGLLSDELENHISVLNKSSLFQLKLSYESTNITSDLLLKDVLSYNTQNLQKNTKHILNTATELLPNVEMSNMKTWTSSLGKFVDPELLMEKTIPNCLKCNNITKYHGLDGCNKNPCKCDLGLKRTTSRKLPTNTFTSQEILENNKSLFVKNLKTENPTSDSRSTEEKSFRPKFGRIKPVANFESNTELRTQHKSKNHLETAANEPDPIEIDLTNQEEENRAHKSNVAKITFKTAKEQLLATNPAAKRTLGATRKAQGKFVSPMIGAQENKQENPEPVITDESLKHLDPKMVELIESEIIDRGTPIGWEDIAGLELAKSVIQEAVVWPLLRPDIFTGLRRPPKGILLFGPPGTGKTLIGKCVAAQCRATFFSISASSLTSKWVGDGEKMVRALFAVARARQPAVVFIDEIDSLLSARCEAEHESTRRIKTEFLVQLDGAATAEEERILIVGATNRPQELDEAARRRLVKRLYIPLPDLVARKQIITNLLRSEPNDLSESEIEKVAALTDGYSGADMKSLCSEAAMGPIRAVPLAEIATIHRDHVRAVSAHDFTSALQRVRPSVSPDDLGQYVRWNHTYGQGF